MTEFRSDELYLKGRLQIETALGALAYTGINPDAQQKLQTFLNVHSQLSGSEDQNDLSIYLQGDTVEKEKADIFASLDALGDSESATKETRIFAIALRETLQ
jgi:hypothetical protein